MSLPARRCRGNSLAGNEAGRLPQRRRFELNGVGGTLTAAKRSTAAVNVRLSSITLSASVARPLEVSEAHSCGYSYDLSGDTEASQPQLPRFRLDGQAPESLQPELFPSELNR